MHVEMAVYHWVFSPAPGCGELTLNNGVIMYSDLFAVNSVATHICDADLGYMISGSSNQRTCEISDTEGSVTGGWSGSDITCMCKSVSFHQLASHKVGWIF